MKHNSPSAQPRERRLPKSLSELQRRTKTVEQTLTSLSQRRAEAQRQKQMAVMRGEEWQVKEFDDEIARFTRLIEKWQEVRKNLAGISAMPFAKKKGKGGAS